MTTDGYFTAYIDQELTERWTNDMLSLVLTLPAYAPDLTTDSTRANIPVPAIIGEAFLQNVTVVNGRLLCDSVTFVNIEPYSTQIMSMVLVNSTTNKLIAVFQTVTGLQIAPNGSDIVLNIDPAQGLLAI